MTEQSPYSSPEAQQHPPFAPQQFRSNVPKVFGIIHIIYAVLGIGMIFSLFNKKKLGWHDLATKTRVVLLPEKSPMTKAIK